MSKIPFAMDAQTVYSEYNTTRQGLNNVEAKKRLAEYGNNELTAGKQKSSIRRFFEQFKDFMLIILIISACVTAIIALVRHEYSDLIDSGIILAIVIINAIIGFVQESKSIDALAALRKISAPTARVFRNGQIVEILAREVVPGDIVYFEAGDIVCADCYLVEAHSLRSDESSLTGESVEVEKEADIALPVGTVVGDRKNLLHSGCAVTYGRGVGVVVATGMNTEMGKIAKMLDGGEEELTPIQKKLKSLGKTITYGVVIVALLVFIVNVVIGGQDFVTALMLAIALAVAAIPESLPAVITIIMSLGVSNMSKKRAIVKKLHAVETLGSCQIICTDKTGTLTQNKMTVEAFFANGKIYEKENLTKLRSLHFFNCMVLCNDSTRQGDKYLGDPTETALLVVATKCGHEIENMRDKYPRKNEIPFDSMRKLMTTINEVNGEFYAYTKGAPDVVIKNCTHYELNGTVQPMTEKVRAEINANINQLSSQGLRSLAYAYKQHSAPNLEKSDETRMTFLGLSAMRDPPRPETKDAVATCISAGIKPIMITGDHVLTAQAIATEVGIFHDGDKILTGAELDAMSDEDFNILLPHITVYARVSPQNKLRIVNAWKATGAVVAMTGDGVNDSPSIKAADIGVGMGKTGTEVTKRVSDVVLTDDNFATIVGAVSEGRRIYTNIKKVVQFLFGTNIVEVLTILLITLIYPTLGFLTAMQILFVNLVTDSLPAISLSVESEEADNMRRPPRPRKDNFFTGIWDTMLVQVIWQTALIVGTFAISYAILGDHTISTTMSFLILATSQLFHIVNVRHQHSLFVSKVFSNKVFWFTLVISFGIIFAVALIPPVAVTFGLTQLTFVQWLIVFGLSFSIIPIIELYKLIKYSILKRKKKSIKIY